MGYFLNIGSFWGSPYYIRDFADAQSLLARQYVAQMMSASAAITPPTINPQFPDGGPPPTPITVPAPSFEDIVWSAPGLPAAFTGTLSIDTLMPEPFEDDPPPLSIPGVPTFAELAPSSPAVNFTFEDPALDLTLPVAPQLLSLTISSFDGLTIPTAPSQDVPTLTLAEPGIVPYTPGAGYTSSLLSSVSATLLSRITNGGTGLNPAAENAIWDRGREREYRQAADALDELERMESLGYALPPGVYVDARLKIQTELAAQAAGHSREVMIKQAELEYQNVRDALSQANQLESTLIQSYNALEQRLFESARYATQSQIEVYNGKVRAYAAYLDAYKTKVQIYEAQVRGELAKVEAYKAQVDAETAKAQVNTAAVQQYKAQVDAALSAVEVYKARIAAVQTKAQIEKLKVEIFGEQVRAYTGKVNAYTANVEGVRAQIQAEASKQEAYKTKVQAYTASVDAQVKQIDARIAEYKARIEAKNAEYDAYKAQVQAESARVQGLASLNDSIAKAYTAEVSGQASFNDAVLKLYQVQLDQAQRVSEISLQAAKANAELQVTARAYALEAAKVGATVSAQLGAAALNAVNWSNSVSSSESESYSNSTSQSTNNNNSTSVSTSVSTQTSSQDSQTTINSNSVGQNTNTNYNYSASV